MFEIDFLKNGFDVSCINGNKVFITYQSISSISDVYIDYNTPNYDWFSDCYIDDKVGKYAYFVIRLLNGKNIKIVVDKAYKWFRRYDKEAFAKMSFFKRLFNSAVLEGQPDEVAAAWLKDEFLDMDEPIAESKKLRNVIIENFNNWKHESEV